MKKFIIYLLIVIAAVSIGFATYMLVKNRETFALVESIKYVNAGEEFELDYIWENRRSELSIISYNSAVVEYNAITNKFTAKSGGETHINFQLDGSLLNRNNGVHIFVGDGTRRNPYYIKTAEQLNLISESTSLNALDKSYKLVRDINLQEANSTNLWLPIGAGSETGYNGYFDGDGHTIKNININPVQYMIGKQKSYDFSLSGLFSKIGIYGSVVNLKIEDIKVTGASFDYVGAITGINYGTIERCEIKNASFKVTTVAGIGGAAGKMVSTELGVDDETVPYTRLTARVDRVSANVLIGAERIMNDSGVYDYTVTGTAGIIGGLVGENEGGIVIYSYSKGEVYLNADTQYYGGLIGWNRYIDYQSDGNKYIYDNGGGQVKDCYANIKLYTALVGEANVVIGGIIGCNDDTLVKNIEETSTNKIIGNYYNSLYLNITEAIGETLVDKDYQYGIGLFLKDTAQVSNDNKEYSVTAYTTDELKLLSNYNSHLSGETVIAWKFGTVWNISSDINNGLPYLNYNNIIVSDEINNVSDSITIENRTQLKEMKLDGNYVLISDIDLGGEENKWEPIGTINNPFIGSLRAASYETDGVVNYYKIYNLYADGLETSQNIYGGLFGVTAGDNGGFIRDITIEKSTVINFINAGILVGTNGYEVERNYGTFIRRGLSIENVNVLGCIIESSDCVGGIVGINYGSIKNSVFDYKYLQGMVDTESEITLKTSQSGVYIAGITAINYGTIINTKVLSGISIRILPVSLETTSSMMVNAGGIAGFNSGQIAFSYTNVSITSSSVFYGNFGGLAGSSNGLITSSIAETSIVASSTIPTVLVGGAVGKLYGNTRLTDVLVENSAIEGYCAGGLIGEFEFSKPDYYLNYTFKPNGNCSDANIISVQRTGVNNTAVTGSIVGGLAGKVINGVISDAYAITTLTGVDNNSIKAGLVAEITFSGSGDKVSAGIIQKTYNVTTFGDNGQNYAISRSEFLKDAYIEQLGTRAAGYIVNYLFDNDVDGNAAHPASSNWFFDFFNSFLRFAKYSPSSTAELKQEDKFIGFSFSSEIWNFGEENYPTLKSLEDLQNILNS